ncbi:MAG TPA: tetratricopeptide repeat protein, partial [Terriglobales bacterium]|nr:tetratricopeptide repeat protein [Terriglobales bacterium]
YPVYTGMHDFSGNKLSPDVPTLASVLRANGYATGAVIGAEVLDSRFGLNSGFDFYYDHFNVRLLREADLDENERPGNEVMDIALDWLKQNQQRPFFLWIHLYDPHYPYHPPAPFSDEYKDRLYDGEIAFADAQVGRLLRYLKQHQLYDRSLIALTGDHGEGLGEHGEKTHGFFIYNSTMHVPLIFKLAGVPPRQARRQVSPPAILVDVMPTVLNALHVEVPADVQGHSLLPLMEGKKQEGVSDIYGESFLPRLHFNWSELRGIEIGNLHFIDAPKPEIYDLSADPQELHNLYSQKIALASEYQRRLTEAVTRYSSDKSTTEKTGLDPQLLERLKSLGYAAVSGGGDPGISNSSLADPKDKIQTYESISEAIEDSQHGRFQPSIARLETAAKSEPDSVPIHYLLALNYFRSGDLKSAVPEFEKVVKLDPTYALALSDLGEVYGRLGEDDKAITSLKQALQIDATNFTAAYNLGVVYLKESDLPNAAEAFQQSVKINPNYVQGHRALGQVFLASGDAARAVEELRTASHLEPGNPDLHALLAKALAANGLTSEAAEEAERAQQLAAPNR